MADGTRIIDAITNPHDVSCLTNDELEILCAELREQIVQTTSRTGGHLASSLGAVEIIVALHSLLHCPQDKIVFDVGHQAYAHKLLTDRRDRFDTLRQLDGISGFTSPLESEYDVHHSGHASDSLSIALGLAEARALAGTHFKIATVIGDAALGGGMAFEALNHIGQEQLPMLIVLNDNEMSISRPVGALVRHLGYMRAATQYRDARDAVQSAMEEKGRIGQGLVDFGRNMKDSIKQFVVPHAMIFEQLGITCTAPVDGHDVAALRETFEVALRSNGPILVHVITTKGHGYEPAQSNPELFHGVKPFDVTTGQTIKDPSAPPSNPTYTSVFGTCMVREAENDPDVVAITAAMQDGTGLVQFAEKFPRRFFDTGITEEHAVGLAAGLSIAGKKPVVAIYSTFLQRALDQIVIDNALDGNHVVWAIDRAGLVGDDGPTHHGVFDLVYLRMIPHMKILAPSDEAELACALHTALQLDGPVAVRYPRGEAEGAQMPDAPEVLEVGKAVVRKKGSDVALLAFGRMVHVALEAAGILAEQGVKARVVDMRWVKPLDTKAIAKAVETKLVATLEEAVLAGGVGQAVLAEVVAQGSHTPVVTFGLPDEFVAQGPVPEILKRLGLDGHAVAEAILAKL